MTDVGIGQVAQRAGVSVGTVSNFFNRSEVLAPATHERVRLAVEELGYVRNTAARDLRVGRSRAVGLLVLDIGNPFFTELIQGVEDVATGAGLTVTLGNTKESAEKEAAYISLFLEQRVSGVILSPAASTKERLEQLRALGTPVVLVDDARDADSYCSVAVDDAQGGRMAAEHLYERGHRRILVLSGPARIHQVRARVEGALESARALGMDAALERAGAFSAPDARTAVERTMAAGRLDGVTAIFAVNDVMALGVIQALTESHRRVPEDVAVIGYDDIPYAAALSPSLTSVRQPSRVMGMEAMSLLLEETARHPQHAHRHSLFTPQLQVRQTA